MHEIDGIDVGDDGGAPDISGIGGLGGFRGPIGRGLRPRERRWASERLLAVGNPPIPAAVKRTNRATLIDTGDLGTPRPIHLKFKYAVCDANGNPAVGTTGVIWQDSWPIPFSAFFRVTVRRGLGPTSGTVDEVYTVPSVSSGSFDRDNIPFDIITCQSLGIDVEIAPGFVANPAIWFAVVATEVNEASLKDKLVSYNVATQRIVTAANATTLLLNQHIARTQFTITNTSTNAPLWVNFGPGAVVGPPPVATLVLPQNTFARYESPIGGYNGIVTGFWDNAAPDGFALVTEGTQY